MSFIIRESLKTLRQKGESLAAYWANSISEPTSKTGKQVPTQPSSALAEQPAESTAPANASNVPSESQRELALWHAMTGDALRIAVEEKTGLRQQFDKIDMKKAANASNIQNVCDIISRAIELNRLAPP